MCNSQPNIKRISREVITVNLLNKYRNINSQQRKIQKFVSKRATERRRKIEQKWGKNKRKRVNGRFCRPGFAQQNTPNELELGSFELSGGSDGGGAPW